MSASHYDSRPFTRWIDADRPLPSLSPVAARLIEAASNDDTSVADIADLIAKDPSLVTRILKLANSAFFSAPFPVTTARQAVLRIGVQQTRLLALSLSLKDTFPMGRKGGVDYGRFWRLSLYQGLLARSLAASLKTADPEEAFTAGFTLEIGLLVLFQMIADAANEAVNMNVHPIVSLLKEERELYGADHREIGEYMLKRWNFPESIVACQRSYDWAGPVRGPGLPRICAIANELSAFVCGTPLDFADLSRMNEVFGLDGALVNETVAAALEQVDEVGQSLEVEVNGTGDVLELMEKANRALTRLSGKIIEEQAAEASAPPSFETLRAVTGDRTKVVKHTLAAVAHEIRNPLTVVGGFTRRLAKSIDPASHEWKYVQMILSETERLEQVLKGLGEMVER